MTSPPRFPAQEEVWPASPPLHRRCAITTSCEAGNGARADSSTRRGHGHDDLASGQPRDGIRRQRVSCTLTAVYLLPHGLFAARRVYPLGLDNAVTLLARAICPDAKRHVERPLVPPHDAETRQQAQQVAEQSDFPQIRGLRRLGPGHYTITWLRQQLAEEGRGCFYTTEPDPDSESNSYDPTRECFNIDGVVATTDDTQDAATGGRAPTAREDPRRPGNDGQVNPPP